MKSIAARPAWWTVFAKEVIENSRDRRTLMTSLLLGPLIGPILFTIMLGFTIAKQIRDSEATLLLPVVGPENAPNLIIFLKQQGVHILPAPDDAEADIRDQKHPVVLRIPADYPKQWRDGEPAVVELLHDSSRQDAQTPYERVKVLIAGYTKEMGALRLLARGVAPVVGSPLALAERDLSTAQSRAGLLLAILPYFLVVAIFIGGMYLAIDVTAGERERQSLEPLLMTPVARDQLVIGKLLAISVYALLSVAISVVAFAVCLRFVPTAELGFDLKLPPANGLMIWFTAAPLALVASALQTLAAARAKTFREAQSYLQLMMFIPLVPSLMQMINPGKPPEWLYRVPIFSQSLLIGGLGRGEWPSMAHLGLSWATTLVLALLLAYGAILAYRQERVAFGLP